ncbi:MAG: carboxypeptidase regulatory-like domain-containing protein [Acidobacteriota bacterium]|nr:carboxypeptidase regulatory-like domain-containing protein [Acidobacteriota bacterium]
MQQRTLWKAIPVLTMMMAAACGGGDGGGETPTAAPEAAAPAFDPATAGNVSGMVMIDGEMPAAEELGMNSDPVCAMSATDTMSNTFVGSNGHLGNVFVYVKEGLEGQSFPAATETVTLNQEGCRYTPHVFGVQVGQTVQIINGDPTLHNIHATPAVNDEFNMGQPIQGMTFERTFDSPEVMVPFKCDVHGWMNAYVGVLDHPYFATTSQDGMFDISSLPPGDYVIEAWHEALGTQTQNITVTTGGTAEVAFTFSAS